MSDRRVLIVVMDGVGVREERFGNAVRLAWTPAMDWLKQNGLYTTLQAHGTAVGLPSDDDIGNSEVGHNALGAGRVFAQGATLVKEAIASERIFAGPTWRDLLSYVGTHEGTLHFLGLLSDGNVHAHEEHLYAMLARAKADGVKRVRVHVLFDGRDVGEKSAETYVERLERTMAELRSPDFDVLAASGGGRMRITMDRYEADWGMVQRGWRVHVAGRRAGLPVAPRGPANLPQGHRRGRPVSTRIRHHRRRRPTRRADSRRRRRRLFQLPRRPRHRDVQGLLRCGVPVF